MCIRDRFSITPFKNNHLDHTLTLKYLLLAHNIVSVFISVGRDGTDGRHGIPGRNGIPGRQGLPGNYNYILVLGLILFEPRVRESGKFCS